MSSTIGPSTPVHHVAVRTRNITTAMSFYSMFGFETSVRFTASPGRAAMMTQKVNNATTCRLELIEVPAFLLNEPEGKIKQAVDLLRQPGMLGLNHFALDTTHLVKEQNMTCLSEWMEQLNQTSIQTFGKALRVAMPPGQKMIGREVYDIAYLYDADGSLVELITLLAVLPQEIEPDW